MTKRHRHWMTACRDKMAGRKPPGSGKNHCFVDEQRHIAPTGRVLSEATDVWKSITMSESRATRIRRLVYQSSYTGMKETDLLLGRFAADHLAGLSDDDLDLYEDLLDAGDGQIYLWVSGTEVVPARYDTAVLELIKEFRNVL
ncbi:succinate dehydrogenase assembly factor 2 [Alphaproteobacteria bacterium LSUCC0719]